MRKASEITREIVEVADKISDLEWDMKEAKNRFKILQRELEHYLKFNQTIKLD